MMGFAAALAFSLAVASSAGWMTGEEIHRAFAGRTISGFYATGLTFTESYTLDGRADYREPERRLTGRWSVVAGSFCTIYDDGESGGCFRVRRVGPNCYEFFVAARTEEEAATAPEPLGWTARGWRVGERSSCDGVPSV